MHGTKNISHLFALQQHVSAVPFDHHRAENTSTCWKTMFP